MSKDKKEIRWIEKIAKRALSVLGLKNHINIQLEGLGSRFTTEDNACEVEGNNLYVNSIWLEKFWRDTDETEVRLLIYHEMRHLYQHEEVRKMQNKENTNEPLPIVWKWMYEFTHYKRNEGGDSTLSYFLQSVEIDAYAFGIYLLNDDKNRGDKLSLNTRSIPDEIENAIIKRAEEIARK